MGRINFRIAPTWVANQIAPARQQAPLNMREVYGVRRIAFDEAERTVRVEFDASRLKEPVIAALLRRTGLDLGEQLILA